MTTQRFLPWLRILVVACCFGLLPLHALDWQPGGGHRSAALAVPASGKPGFSTLAPSQTGVSFTNFLPASRHLTNQILLNGSGVAAGDVDGDGLCDLYFCALDRPNALYRNLGQWKFQDITAQANVACAGLSSSGAALADLDGDNDLDLLVNTVGHGTHLFANDGRGRFTEIAKLNGTKGGTSLALGDLDGDGFLDLYVANYRTRALMDMPNTFFNFATVNGQRVISRVAGRPLTDPEFTNRFRLNIRGGIEENGELDEVYRNVGGKSFAPLSFTDGTFLDEDGRALASPPFDWGLSVLIRDLNQDGLPDIWVCNDFDTADRVWLNVGGGKFRAAPRLALRKNSHFSMGADVADINRDGFDDVFVLDMLSRDHAVRMDMQGTRGVRSPGPGIFNNRPEYLMNTLFLNRGDGTWAEIAQLAGLDAAEWAWATLFLDVDLDGYEDVLITNGNERQSRSLDIAERLRKFRTEQKPSNEQIFEARKMFPRYASPNLAFRNRGNLTFEDTSKAWGFDFNGVSHGMALADLDNDGDQDVVVNNLNDAAGIYRNDSPAPRVAVRLKGTAPNTRGIGARIRVSGGAVREQSQEVMVGGRYLSSDEPLRVFAAGSPTNEVTIQVTWRSGKESVLRGARANRIYEIEEASAGPAAPRPRSHPTPHFEDVSARLGHRHVDEPFDDFAQQPLLPNQLSQLGPGVSWGDLDRDGWEDLVIASGKGGQLAAFRNDRRGGFQQLDGPPFAQPVTRDQTAVLFVRRAGETLLLAGSANYEDGLTNGAVAREFNLTRRMVEESLPGQDSSTGPMALADVDGDGELDLFVGGRVLAARWPAAASSLIFRGQGGRFVPDAGNTQVLVGVGLVSGAVFSDLNADGFPELVLSCEWGPLRIFRNDRGKLAPWDWNVTVATATNGLPSRSFSTLTQLTGCWQGVTAGDFDGDGRLDLAAANWGRNTRYESHRTRPLQLLYGDLTGDGMMEVIEAYYDETLRKVVPERQLDFLARPMPFLRARFNSNTAFAQASIEEILGEQMPMVRRLEAAWMESTVFLNRGDRFEVRPLPVAAQVAPAFAVCAADLDGDGAEDLFLSQNFFSMQPDTPRYDGGSGLWLRGDGSGGFGVVTSRESGLQIHGEQRGAAVADFDHDGRTDLVVTQNGAETKLYRNAGAKPGLRVRLTGGAGNSDAVGAVIRWKAGDRLGPAREVRAGSGYWSQDAAVQVLSVPADATQLQLRWPGGAATAFDIPAGAHEVTIEAAKN